MDEHPATFTDALKAHRRGKGLSLEKAAREVDVSLTTLSRWEAGRVFPAIGQRERVAAWLGLTLTQLEVLIAADRKASAVDVGQVVSLLAEIPARLDDLEARMTQLEQHAR